MEFSLGVRRHACRPMRIEFSLMLIGILTATSLL